MLSITVYYVGGVSQETDEEHPDWSHLQRAFDAMVGANSRINEFKRRKDLGKLNMTFQGIDHLTNPIYIAVLCAKYLL